MFAGRKEDGDKFFFFGVSKNGSGQVGRLDEELGWLEKRRGVRRRKETQEKGRL